MKGTGKILTLSENAHFFYHSPLPVNVNVRTRLKNVNVKTRLKAVMWPKAIQAAPTTLEYT